MIADDRGSYITDNCKESSFHIITDDRRADCSVSGSVKITRTLCWQEDRSKQHDRCRGGNFAASKFTS